MNLSFFFFVLWGLVQAAIAPLRFPPPRHPEIRGSVPGRPGVSNCTELFYTQTIDHFGSFSLQQTYQQRYFVCDPKPVVQFDSPRPIFFYCGNEANVELYVNATGLMWENAERFNALLVFAEHRYFGKSLPFPDLDQPKPPPDHMQFLSPEQALADFATLLKWFKKKHGLQRSAVIGFGGSYGGMLATWFRIKYPSSVQGIIAGSAPITSFLGLDPAYDQNSYADTVTFDATTAGGSVAGCDKAIRAAWPRLFDSAATDVGRQQLNSVFRLCPNSQLKTAQDGVGLAYWLQSAFDYQTMGSYPYPSSYILNGQGTLPAYPMRQACQLMVKQADPMAGLRDAAGVFYNASHHVQCFDTAGSANNETLRDALFWDYLYCTGLVQPMTRNGVTDMFWKQPFMTDDVTRSCQQQWSVNPRFNWPSVEYSGWGIADSVSNIVFSNGQLDPWKKGGVTTNLSSSLIALVIEDVGHHMDLMFSDPRDPAAVKDARATEMAFVEKWIAEHNAIASQKI